MATSTVRAGTQEPKPVMSETARLVGQIVLSIAGFLLIVYAAALLAFSPTTTTSKTTEVVDQQLGETTTVRRVRRGQQGRPSTTRISVVGRTHGIDDTEPTKHTNEDTEVARSDALLGGLFGLGSLILVTGLVLPRIANVKAGWLEITLSAAYLDPTPEEKERAAEVVAQLVQEHDMSPQQAAQLTLEGADNMRRQKEAALARTLALRGTDRLKRRRVDTFPPDRAFAPPTQVTGLDDDAIANAVKDAARRLGWAD